MVLIYGDKHWTLRGHLRTLNNPLGDTCTIGNSIMDIVQLHHMGDACDDNNYVSMTATHTSNSSSGAKEYKLVVHAAGAKKEHVLQLPRHTSTSRMCVHVKQRIWR